MAYRIKAKDKSVEGAVRRIACEQIEKAIASVSDRSHPEAVHDVRKRCKKLRGLVRLVRPAFAGYKDENADFRDTARLISEARDAKVMQDTYDLLVGHYAGQIDRRSLGSIRRRFTLDRKAAAADDDISAKLEQARARLITAKERIASWELEADGWDAVSGGLAKTYGRARRAAKVARAGGDGDSFHELRKRIKYHWYHCRLLENIWPDMMGMRRDGARQLSDIFGDHHDLTVFSNKLAADKLAYGNPREVETAIGLARARQQVLEKRGRPLAHRLLAQSPEAFCDYLAALWDIWRKTET